MLRLQPLWFYGVIVGLSIEQALLTTVPQVLRIGNAAPSPAAEVVRLGVFLLVVTRFYLGAVKHFDDAYGAQEEWNDQRAMSWGLDFLSGTVHFLLFFALALSIDIEARPQEAFSILMVIVLLWDVVWVIATWRYETHFRIRWWSAVNLLTVLVGGSTYLVVVSLFQRDRLVAEQWFLAWVVLVSVLDIAEIVRRRPILWPGVKAFHPD